MTKIDFVPPADGQVGRIWQRWLQDCRKAREELTAAVNNGSSPAISSLYRRKTIKQRIFFNKKGPFKGKCAYCECFLTDFQHGDIEHFRPKLGVTDENDNPIMISDQAGNSIPHPGYYWLAYSWENLLPSCTKCNQAGTIDGQKIGKHNRFPVKGGHAISPAEINAEKPLLINPVIDDPEEHLKIDITTGILGYLSVRGKMCIDIFGLNLREQLVIERKTVCDQIRAKMIELLHTEGYPERRQSILKDLKAMKDGDFAYTLAARAAINKYKTFFNQIS